jgi:ABC-type uncharacterized transport system substrate-binding protein
MNDGQLTTHAEPDPAPFKVHLMVRAGRILRARHGPSPLVEPPQSSSALPLDFAIIGSLVRPGRSRYPVLVHRAAALLRAFFRPHLAMAPLRFANPSPPSGWIEDFHLQAVVRTRRTKEKPRCGGASSFRGIHNKQHQRVTGVSFAKTCDFRTVEPGALATGGVAVRPLMQATRTVPIVFVNTPDPVGAGFVESLARPGGHVTGFTQFEYSTSVKWLELLKQIAPGIKRAGVLRDPNQPSGIGQFGAIQGAASAFGVEIIPLGVRDTAEIERAVTTTARSSNDGLIATTGALTTIHRDLIIALAARHRLPAVYYAPFFAAAGGLLCYGADFLDQFRRAASYVDRILKGKKPADLPVQAPTKYELVINLKTAKALGLEVPPTLLARADELIE